MHSSAVAFMDNPVQIHTDAGPNGDMVHVVTARPGKISAEHILPSMVNLPDICSETSLWPRQRPFLKTLRGKSAKG